MDEPQTLLEIPYQQLGAQTLAAVIESFVLREGTNYGAEEVSHATKVEQVRRQLEKGRIRLVFEVETETVTLLTTQEFKERGL